eukprot:TRINITY_DN16612_c0_g1_i4.p1 TRINITY_DN16612_c0_g1~~TRINITY_DN16612_c0_g1_i4.p1  ORF type:complete len:525 (-),score=59.03 TRINITY_DN16612_c0_g1_i4:57-1589(-)
MAAEDHSEATSGLLLHRFWRCGASVCRFSLKPSTGRLFYEGHAGINGRSCSVSGCLLPSGSFGGHLCFEASLRQPEVHEEEAEWSASSSEGNVEVLMLCLYCPSPRLEIRMKSDDDEFWQPSMEYTPVPPEKHAEAELLWSQGKQMEIKVKLPWGTEETVEVHSLWKLIDLRRALLAVWRDPALVLATISLRGQPLKDRHEDQALGDFIEDGGLLEVSAECWECEVSGCGIHDINGKYFDMRGDTGQASVAYQNAFGTTLCRDRAQEGDGSSWYFAVKELSRAEAVLHSDGNHLRPPSSGWKWMRGREPLDFSQLPTITRRDDDLMDVEVMLLSGNKIGTLSVDSSWSGLEIKEEVRRLVDPEIVETVISSQGILGDGQLIRSHMLHSGSILHVVLASCSYLVENAGVPEVNGGYVRQKEQMNDCPVFKNESGVRLFRYRMQSTGNYFWYFSLIGVDPNKSDGDYYRVKSNASKPPLTGWECNRCPEGRLPTPDLHDVMDNTVASSPATQ